MKRFIAEFEEQGFTQIIFPHEKSDWIDYLEEARENFTNIINAIIKYQKCLVVCDDIKSVSARFKPHPNLHFTQFQTNDTWARDCSALCIEEDGKTALLDFTFTGWGGKFEADKDNAMTKTIASSYSKPLKTIDLILEGGGVESNGADTILTTAECMLNKNRNASLSEAQITKVLQDEFGMSNILYLRHGYLAGDDTDSHIDTLARFIDEKTIAYVECADEDDEHYSELKLMEQELKLISKEHGFELVALPMTTPCYYEDERLPATYANFLFVNGAVLLPVYGVKEDKLAVEIMQKALPHLEIVPINCSTLIKQHGSLHCVTMNFAKHTEAF